MHFTGVSVTCDLLMKKATYLASLHVAVEVLKVSKGHSQRLSLEIFFFWLRNACPLLFCIGFLSLNHFMVLLVIKLS